MLARMNQMSYSIEYQCMRSASYEGIPLQWMEDEITGYPIVDPATKRIRLLIDYFRDLGVLEKKD